MHFASVRAKRQRDRPKRQGLLMVDLLCRWTPGIGSPTRLILLDLCRNEERLLTVAFMALAIPTLQVLVLRPAKARAKAEVCRSDLKLILSTA